MPSTKAIVELISPYSDEVRHTLVVESGDWDKIEPALNEIGNALSNGVNLYSVAVILRVLFEVVYVKGYERGKAEAGKQRVTFIVAPDPEQKGE